MIIKSYKNLVVLFRFGQYVVDLIIFHAVYRSVNESYSEEEVIETHRTVQGEALSQQKIIQMDINYIQKEKDGESVNNSKARPRKSDARKATEVRK